MSCKRCGHDIFDHGDRAVGACGPDQPTTFSAQTGARIPRSKRCLCIGFQDDRAHD